MKKVFIIIVTILIAIAAFILSYNYYVNSSPNVYYMVYMNGEVVGVVNSKKKLEKYINNENKEYQKKYNTKNVYSPNGLDIQKVLTYDGNVDDVKDVYKKIEKISPFTIKGYQVKIKTVYDDEEDGKTKTSTETIYIVNKEDLETSIRKVIATFVGNDKYEAYLNENQIAITDVGEYIDDVYLDNDITIKEVKIPVNETIYSNSTELAQYLLYGGNVEETKYIVKEGDTIESVAFDNQISTEEFLLSNPTFTSVNNLLFIGQELLIKKTNPRIQVVQEKTVVEDQEDKYEVIVQYDSNKYIGDDVVTQQGVNGLERVNMRIKSVNNNIAYVETLGKTTLKPAVDKIVVYGSKYAPSVGILGSWKWPCETHYITQYFQYRIHPITGVRQLHQALDIYNPYYTKVFAANNGTVVTAKYHYSYGNYVVINHNNGYGTLYAHMSSLKVREGQTVARGQIIGYIGSTGVSTGPHLHYETFYTNTNARFNPLNLNYQ